LILEKKNGKITEVKPLLDNLLDNGFYLFQRLYREALPLAEETP
jgi:predicted nucleic acid-binding protein